jgi:hypothetical protein
MLTAMLTDFRRINRQLLSSRWFADPTMEFPKTVGLSSFAWGAVEVGESCYKESRTDSAKGAGCSNHLGSDEKQIQVFIFRDGKGRGIIFVAWKMKKKS